MNLNTRKETKLHTKNNGHYATKADLKDTEHHLNIEILATKHDLKDVKNELKGDIQQIRTALQVMRAEFKTIDERTKTSLNISLVILGAVLAPLAISLFPTLSKLL